MSTKHCKKCDTTKNISEFYKSSQTNDGLYYQCKVCQRAYKNKYDAIKYANNPAYRERIRNNVKNYENTRNQGFKELSDEDQKLLLNDFMQKGLKELR